MPSQTSPMKAIQVREATTSMWSTVRPVMRRPWSGSAGTTWVREAEAGGEEESRGAVREGRSDDEELEAFRTALELRRAQARAAVREQVDPDDEQWEIIDGAVEDMNGTLIGLGEALTAMLASGAEPTRRDAMEFSADALDALLGQRGQQGLGAALDQAYPVWPAA